MEWKIILGLSIIAALLCFASGDRSIDPCVPFPDADVILRGCNEEWNVPGKHPSNDTSEGSRNGDMHCFTKCLYEKMGIFYENQFHNWAIRDIMANYVPHPLSEQLAELSMQAAEAVNREGGDECEMADEFWEYNNTEEFKNLKLVIFCDRDPWLNPERKKIPF